LAGAVLCVSPCMVHDASRKNRLQVLAQPANPMIACFFQESFGTDMCVCHSTHPSWYCVVLCCIVQPCASGYLWFATKQAADALLNRSKVEPIWLRDPRSGHDLALTVKKTRRPGYSSSCSTTTSRISVGMGGLHQGGPLSSTSNSGSSFLPVLQHQLAGLQAAAAQHSQELHSSSARLAAAAAGMGSGNLDTLSMLQNANVMRLMPMQAGGPALLGPSAAMMLQGNGRSTYMAHDVCEAMLDFCDSAGLNMGMPVHLQPTIAAQVRVTAT